MNQKISYYWFKRFGIVPHDAPGLRILEHKGYAVLSLCQFFTDYRPIRTLFCTLSSERDMAVSELESIGRFTSLHPIESLTLYIRGNYLSEIVPLLSQNCRCPDLSLVGDIIYQEETKFRRRRFKDQSWDHLVSLSASSPILFNSYGRQIALNMMSSQHLQELRLDDKSLSPRGWALLLSRVSIPNLTVFDIDGRVSLDSICSFLARHIGVQELTLGSSILSRSYQSNVVVLPNLSSLHAPAQIGRAHV